MLRHRPLAVFGIGFAGPLRSRNDPAARASRDAFLLFPDFNGLLWRGVVGRNQESGCRTNDFCGALVVSSFGLVCSGPMGAALGARGRTAFRDRVSVRFIYILHVD